MFRIWQSKLTKLYSLAQLQLLMVDNIVSSYFPSLQFMTCTLNCSAQPTVDWHVDSKNLAFDMCAVGVFGQFDCSQSDQMVFAKVKLILEVKAGDIVFFSSALLPHKSELLTDSESRRVIVFYSAVDLFHWISQSHKTQDGLSRNDEQRWIDGCNLLSTLDSFTLF